MSDAIVVEAVGDVMRVGDETRPLRFHSHEIFNYVFKDGLLLHAGTWNTRRWSDVEVASYEVRMRKFRWRERQGVVRLFKRFGREIRKPSDHAVFVSGLTVLDSRSIQMRESM